MSPPPHFGARPSSADSVIRLASSWLVERSTDSGLIERREFPDSERGAAACLPHALAWQSGMDCSSTRDGASQEVIDFPRLSLQRRVSCVDGAVEFEISIQPSGNLDLARWMRLSLGTHLTLTQLRIDAALATLEARWCAWFAALKSDPSIKPADIRLRRLGRDGKAPLVHYQLHLEDVMCWTGQGRGIAYSPSRTTNAHRRLVYLPEIGSQRKRKESDRAESVAA